MKKFILASNNNHKIKEIKEILKDFDFEILSLKEAGINIILKKENLLKKRIGSRTISKSRYHSF